MFILILFSLFVNRFFIFIFFVGAVIFLIFHVHVQVHDSIKFSNFSLSKKDGYLTVEQRKNLQKP